MAAPSTPPNRDVIEYHSRGARLTVSDTYRLMQEFHPKDVSEKFFLKDAPDIVPLMKSAIIPKHAACSSTPTSISNETAAAKPVPILAWTPYREVIKDTPRTYLLGMILLGGKPTGYALSLNVVEKRKNRKLVLKFVGKHIGGFRWILAFDVLGQCGLEFEVGPEQGERANVVFNEGLSELIAKFEGDENGFSGAGGILNQYIEKGVEQLEHEWSFLVSPTKTPPPKPANPTHQVVQPPRPSAPSPHSYTTAISPSKKPHTPMSFFNLSPADETSVYRELRRSLNPPFKMTEYDAFSTEAMEATEVDDSTDVKVPGRLRLLTYKFARGITSLIIELAEIGTENLFGLFQRGPKPKGVFGARLGFDNVGGTQTIWNSQVSYNVSHVKWIPFSLMLALSFCFGVWYGKEINWGLGSVLFATWVAGFVIWTIFVSILKWFGGE